MNVWQEIVQSLGITGIVGTVAYFVFQKFVDASFKNKAESFKHDLNIQLEEHKSRLSIEFEKAARLHERRLNVIADFYELVADLRRTMAELTAVFKMVQEDYEKEENERMTNAANAYNEFIKFYSKSRIFFRKETCELVDQLQSNFRKTYEGYTFPIRFKFRSDELTHQKMIEVTKIMEKEIPVIMGQVEDDFRSDIGLLNGQ